MANAQIGVIDVDFINKKRVAGDAGADLTTPLNFTSITAMRSALSTADSSYYTSARLDRMTANDMVYALRVLTENGITSTGTI